MKYSMAFYFIIVTVQLCGFSGRILTAEQKNSSTTLRTPFSTSTTTTKPEFYKPIASCSNLTRKINGQKADAFKPSIELWPGLGMFVAVLIGTTLIAHAFRMIRKYIYREKNGIESIHFDAGETISGGLTAATIVAQWTWAASLLQSSNVASSNGVSGAFWYASGASIQIILFAMVAVQLRIRAPGAKTFLQLIFCRFGAKTHLVYVCFAFVTNLIVTAMLMAGGCAVAAALIQDCPVALASIFIAATVACYTLLGGLGAVFYVSYFCAVVILIIIVYFIFNVFYVRSEYLGSRVSINNLLSCLLGPEGNEDRSYNTFSSKSGFIFGIINIVGNFGTVFVDQSYWQIAVAAKPKEAVYGFIMGGIAWFAVPFGMATAMGLGYLALGASLGAPLLSPEDKSSGLVPAVVAQTLLGVPGALLILLAVILAVISTASAEVTAVTSIIIHDLFKIYFKPFRQLQDANSCILCGKSRSRIGSLSERCQCCSKANCKECAGDDVVRANHKSSIKPDYQCSVHGKYRRYTDDLNSLRNWPLIICSFALIPLTVFLDVLKVRLGWLYAFMGIAVGSAVIPISLSVFWTRLTSEGMMCGAIGGCISGLIVWLGLANRLEHGLAPNYFYQNSGEDFTMLGGNLVSILGGGVICVLVSLCTKPPMDMSKIWDRTYDIDSPLYPWAEMYQNELGLTGGNRLEDRPSFHNVYSAFRKLSWIANGIGTSSTFILIILWPALMLTTGVFSQTVFSNWIGLVVSWVAIATIYVTLAPVYEEIVSAWEVHSKLKKNRIHYRK